MRQRFLSPSQLLDPVSSPIADRDRLLACHAALVKLLGNKAPEPLRLARAFLKHPALFDLDPRAFIAAIKTRARLLRISSAELVKLGLRLPRLFLYDTDKLRMNVANARVLGFKHSEFLNIVSNQPSYLLAAPTRVTRYAKALMQRFSIDRRALVRLITKQPAVLGMKPETVAAHIREGAAGLGISKETLARCMLRCPIILCMRTETLLSRAAEAARNLGITRKAFVAIAIKEPQLLYQNPDRAASNIERSAALLSLTRQQFISLVKRRPALLASKPETLAANAARDAARLGLTMTQYVPVLMKGSYRLQRK